MSLDLFQINAFTNDSFGGNPACVIPLKKWLPDNLLLKIAKENAVAETAYFIKNKDKIELRWFTPEIEMDLCGHATLATAHCLISILDYTKNEIEFETKSGKIKVVYENNLYHLDLPSKKPIISELPQEIKNSLNIIPKEVYKSRDYLLLYETEEEVQQIRINTHFFNQINLNTGGVIITSTSKSCDFVSRFFTPQASILEDPVTGSAHCSLVPFWAEKLNKSKLEAKQISKRLGVLKCENKDSRVIVSGKAKTYFTGKIYI